MYRWAVFGLLAVQFAWAQTAADAAVLTALKHTEHSLDEVAVWHRRDAGGGLDVVIAIGTPKSWPLEVGPARWWGENRRLGLFLQERRRPDRVYAIAAAAGFEDCSAQLERVTATDTVISCTGEKGMRHPHQKFVYDVHAKALAGRISYEPFAMYAAFPASAGAVFVGSDTQGLVAVAYDPGRSPAPRVLNEAEGRAWTSQVRTDEGTVGIERRRVLSVRPEEFRPVSFGPAEAFTLAQEPGNSLGPRLLILERRGAQTVRHELPQSTYEAFAAARPQRVREGYSRKSAEFDDRIGPWKIEGDRLWFGKTFYDGEGITGVGGFGYFDAAARRFRIWTPPEIVDWSVAAIDVSAGSVWLALVRNGEWGRSAGGLLRFDRRTEAVRRLALPDIGRRFVRSGEALLLATDFGIAVIRGDRVERHFVDRAADGSLRIAAAER